MVSLLESGVPGSGEEKERGRSLDEPKSRAGTAAPFPLFDVST